MYKYRIRPYVSLKYTTVRTLTGISTVPVRYITEYVPYRTNKQNNNYRSINIFIGTVNVRTAPCLLPYRTMNCTVPVQDYLLLCQKKTGHSSMTDQLLLPIVCIPFIFFSMRSSLYTNSCFSIIKLFSLNE